jgi:glycerol uptake facilitator-like aquaporin
MPRRLSAEALGSIFLSATVIGSGAMPQRLAGGNEAVALLANTFVWRRFCLFSSLCSHR